MSAAADNLQTIYRHGRRLSLFRGGSAWGNRLALFLIVAGLVWLADATGVDVPYDPDAIETVVTSVALALVTYITTNVKR